MDTIVTFESVHQALKSESELLKGEQSVSLITTPRSVSSQCGFSLELENVSAEETKKILIEKKLKFDALYEKSVRDGVKYYAKKD